MNQHVRNVVTVAVNNFKSVFFKPRYYLAVCCIAKDENHYLKEWISYHMKVGVQHFFIYDNGSKTPIQQTIDALGLSSQTTVITFPGVSRQIEAYQHCLQNFGSLSKWIAFIDVDEFIVPKSNPNDLAQFLKRFEPYGGLGVNWVFFGSNGYLNKSDEPQLRRFIRRAQYSFSVNRHIKSIVQPKYVRAVRDPHSFKYVMGKHCVNEKLERIDGPFADVSVEAIQINHYFCRSLEEYVEKIKRGRADNSEIERSLEQFHSFDKVANDIEDSTITAILDKA